MELLLHWITEHGFDLLGSFGIVTSLIFTALSFRREARSRRVANLLTLTSSHRDIWRDLYSKPSLARILERRPDIDATPVRSEESLFVAFLIQHLYATWQASREGEFPTGQNVAEDIRRFFSLPIPRRIWNSLKVFHDPEFVTFIESLIRRQ